MVCEPVDSWVPLLGRQYSRLVDLSEIQWEQLQVDNMVQHIIQAMSPYQLGKHQHRSPGVDHHLDILLYSPLALDVHRLDRLVRKFLVSLVLDYRRDKALALCSNWEGLLGMKLEPW